MQAFFVLAPFQGSFERRYLARWLLRLSEGDLVAAVRATPVSSSHSSANFAEPGIDLLDGRKQSSRGVSAMRAAGA